jgi:flagellar hook-associated protein 3 FlgL
MTRVTNNQYSQEFVSQLQGLLSTQNSLQKQASSGLKFSQASDDPTGYKQALVIQNRYAGNQSYLDTVKSVQSMGEYNHQAMTDLQTALSSASEVATKVNSTYSASDLGAMAAQIDGILSQVSDIANRQKDGNYLFGGTSNVEPITVTSGSPNTYSYTSGTTSDVTTVQISSAGTTLKTGIVAGSPTAASPYSGFLYDSTSGTDTIATLTKLRDTLTSAGDGSLSVTDAVAQVQGMLKDVNATVDLASEYVGKTAANLQLIDASNKTLTNNLQSDKTDLSSVTSVDLADVVARLQSAETNYSAALQSGASILKMSLLNYI